MAWGLDDLAKLVNGLQNTFSGGRPGQVGNRNVQDAIVKPGKVLSDFSGVSQGYKGAGPDASNMDRSMALLALAGMLGGQEAAMGLKGALTPEYAYGVHVSPVPGLKKIKPGSKVGMGDGGNFGDAIDGMSYFFKTGNDKDLAEIQKAVNTYLERLSGGTREGATAYSVKTPLKHIQVDENMGSFATQTPKNLKVLNSSRQRPLAVAWDFQGIKGPHLPDNTNQLLKSLANLIKDNPKYSKMDSKLITQAFEEKLNKNLAEEIIQHNEFVNRTRPKKVQVKNKKATP